MTSVLTAAQRDGSPARMQSRARFVDCGILAFSIIPLLLTAHLPLADMPNHLARQYVIRDLPASSILQQYYYVKWALVPNLAMELFVAAVRPFVSIETALRVFCIVALALTFGGTRLINLAVGGDISRIYRIAPLFFYSGPFQFGFLNFCFGVGVALVTFGLYLRYRRGRAIVIVPAFALAGFLILLCHLAAFGLYATAVSAFELADALERSGRAPWRTSAARLIAAELRAARHLLPPILIFAGFGQIPNAHNFITWATLYGKAVGIAALFMFSSPEWEVVFLALTVLGTVVAFLVGAVRLDRRAWPMVVLMAALFFLLPRVLLGTSYVDYRIPSGAIFFILGFAIPGPSAKRFTWFASWFFGLVVVRVVFIAALWLTWEPVLAQFDSALQMLPLGARLMVVEGTAQTSESRRPPLGEIAALVVARRQGFEPNFFAGIAGEIVNFQPKFRPLYQLTPDSTLDAIDPAYNYLLVLRPSRARISPQLPLTLLARGNAFELFRIDASKTP